MKSSIKKWLLLLTLICFVCVLVACNSGNQKNGSGVFTTRPSRDEGQHSPAVTQRPTWGGEDNSEHPFDTDGGNNDADNGANDGGNSNVGNSGNSGNSSADNNASNNGQNGGASIGETYAVTFFDINGKELVTMTVKPGGRIEAPAAPRVAGMEFLGWDTSLDAIWSDLSVHPIYRVLSVDSENPPIVTAAPPASTTPPTTDSAATPMEVPVLKGTVGLSYADNSEGGKSVSRGQSDVQDVIVMTAYGGKKVTAVAANGFNPLYSSTPYALKSVNLQTGIEKIGAAAFSACNELTYVVLPATLEEIGNQAFWGCDALDTVYYGGTAEQWAVVAKGADNEALVKATFYYYSETKPMSRGNFWHYVNNVPTAW